MIGDDVGEGGGIQGPVHISKYGKYSYMLLLITSHPSRTWNQYFLMPYRFLQECWNSGRFHQIPLEWNWNWPGFQWNPVEIKHSCRNGTRIQILQSHILRYIYTGYTSFFLATIWSLFASLYSFFLLTQVATFII